MEAYARLTIYHGETNILLCDAIVARQSDLVPALVIKAGLTVCSMKLSRTVSLDSTAPDFDVDRLLELVLPSRLRTTV